MATSPPVVVEKKRGMGCLGCGCLTLAVLVVLFLGLVVGVSYLTYQKVVSITSTTPGAVPSFNGSDDLYQTAVQKVEAFQHDLQNHQAATIQLSADEINTLIAREPSFAQNNVHVFVTLTGSEARVQGSVPTDRFVQGLLKGRYVTFDATFGVDFNSQNKAIDLLLHSLQIGDQTTPQNLLPTMQAEINPLLNAQLRKNSDLGSMLDQAKTVEFRDGMLNIETQ
jgi:hypothetical protein